MIHPQPPFGMEREITQVQYPHQGAEFIPKTASASTPFGRPACYVKSAKPCGVCPYKEDCANAEGR